MASIKDPYLSILDLMNGAGSKSAGACGIVGSIISVSPLLVQCNGLELDADDLLVNDMLLSGYARGASIGEESGTLTMGAGLQAGDMVLLVPSADMQQFYLICVLKAVT